MGGSSDIPKCEGVWGKSYPNVKDYEASLMFQDDQIWQKEMGCETCKGQQKPAATGLAPISHCTDDSAEAD